MLLSTLGFLDRRKEKCFHEWDSNLAWASAISALTSTTLQVGGVQRIGVSRQRTNGSSHSYTFSSFCLQPQISQFAAVTLTMRYTASLINACQKKGNHSHNCSSEQTHSLWTWISAPLAFITHPIFINATSVTQVVCNYFEPEEKTKPNRVGEGGGEHGSTTRWLS